MYKVCLLWKINLIIINVSHVNVMVARDMIYVLDIEEQRKVKAKILDQISNLIDKTEYKTTYIEIQTDSNKYILEKDKRNQIGFNIDTK